MKEQTWQQWARSVQRDPTSPSHIKKGSLAPLTGTDVRALDVFAAVMKLYAYTDTPRALEAARLAVESMQPGTRWIARELIPYVLDWSDRGRLWPLIMQREDDESLADVGS